jgi:hypothetical protein
MVRYINFAKKCDRYQILPDTYGGGSKNVLYGQWPPYSFKNWIDNVGNK